MIEQRGQPYELAPATSVWAVIQFVVMSRRSQMLVQCAQGVVLAVAEVALGNYHRSRMRSLRWSGCRCPDRLVVCW